jgi:excisionase family DNA binding protein
MTQQDPMYLTIKELAAILRVDHKTIRNAIKDGSIEAVRVGRAFRIPTSAIDALAEARRQRLDR